MNEESENLVGHHMLLTVFERCPKENISRARSGEMTRCVNEKTHKDGINELGAWKIRLKNQQSVHVARCRYLQYKLWTKSIHGASMIKTQYSHPFAQLLPAPEFEVRYVSGRKRCPRTPLRSYDKQFQSIEILSNEHLYTPCCRHQSPNLLEHFVVHIV